MVHYVGYEDAHSLQSKSMRKSLGCEDLKSVIIVKTKVYSCNSEPLYMLRTSIFPPFCKFSSVGEDAPENGEFFCIACHLLTLY